MHLLVVATMFPSPDNPYSGSFVGEQVRALAQWIERITVLCPVPRMPPFASRIRRVAGKAALPQRDNMIKGQCEVLFPRHLKAPGYIFLSWTMVQWCRIVNQTIAQFAEICPVSIIHAHSEMVSS